MERRYQYVLAPRSHDSISDPGEHLDPWPHVFEERCPNEDPRERLVEAVDLEVLLEGMDLPPEPVAFDERIHQAEQRLARARRRRRSEDHPGTRAPYRTTLVEVAPYAVEEARGDHHLPYRGGFPAGHDDPGQPFEVLHGPHLDRLGAESAQYLGVLPEVSLQREHPDLLRDLFLARHAVRLAVTSHGSRAALPLPGRPSPCRPDRKSVV